MSTDTGTIIEEYFLIKKPDIVIIVPMTSEGELIYLEEYKHGAGRYLNVLPAGHIKSGESYLEAAKRELLEETGYAGDVTSAGELFEYPSMDCHKVHVFIARDVQQVADPSPEQTESLRVKKIQFAELKGMISKGEWKSSSSLSAILLSGIFK